MRFRMTVEYAGTRYSGWQIQKNARTIQGELERAVREATGAREIETYGSGRTDAGVHALAQVAHLDLQTTLPPETLRRRGRRADSGMPARLTAPASGLFLERVYYDGDPRHAPAQSPVRGLVRGPA
jgi:tRNA U38,U39,U40 pseudouridine synthase TruA